MGWRKKEHLFGIADGEGEGGVEIMNRDAAEYKATVRSVDSNFGLRVTFHYLSDSGQKSESLFCSN